MKSKAVIFVATLAFAFAFGGCSDSVVGTDDEATNPLFKKGGNKPPPDPNKPPPDPGEVDFRPVAVTFTDAPGAGVRSDGHGPYVDGTCGVWANIGNFADARFDPDRDYKRNMARDPECDAARALEFDFSDDRETRIDGIFMSVEDLDDLAVGDDVTGVHAQFNVCNTLVYVNVRAVRTSATSWTVTTDLASAAATCSGDGSTQNMPFTLEIEEIPAN